MIHYCFESSISLWQMTAPTASARLIIGGAVGGLIGGMVTGGCAAGQNKLTLMGLALGMFGGILGCGNLGPIEDKKAKKASSVAAATTATTATTAKAGMGKADHTILIQLSLPTTSESEEVAEDTQC